jgi:hypothetical protein
MRLAAAVLAAVTLLAACAGSKGEEERAKDSFGVYREAEATRAIAEGALGHVFRDISNAANAHDRAGVLAAVGRGKEALATIDSSLAIEIGAAEELARYEPTRKDGGRLRDALRRSRDSARFVDRQLEIASRDPFLEVDVNGREVSRLSSASVRVSVPAAFARRRAVRAIALTLGVEPPVDVIFDGPKAKSGG